jgi:hypothetical protein
LARPSHRRYALARTSPRHAQQIPALLPRRRQVDAGSDQPLGVYRPERPAPSRAVSPPSCSSRLSLELFEDGGPSFARRQVHGQAGMEGRSPRATRSAACRRRPSTGLATVDEGKKSGAGKGMHIVRLRTGVARRRDFGVEIGGELLPRPLSGSGTPRITPTTGTNRGAGLPVVRSARRWTDPKSC